MADYNLCGLLSPANLKENNHPQQKVRDSI